MIILKNKDIELKVNRLAVEVMEYNSDEDEIVLLGINNRGYKLAQYIYQLINKRRENYAKLGRIKLNPANPVERQIEIDIDINSLKDKTIIMFDDVANTGRTLFYALQPLMKILPKKVEIGVLVDRKHKSFPIHVKYVGLSLSTTVQQHIEVNIENRKIHIELI